MGSYTSELQPNKPIVKLRNVAINMKLLDKGNVAMIKGGKYIAFTSMKLL